MSMLDQVYAACSNQLNNMKAEKTALEQTVASFPADAAQAKAAIQAILDKWPQAEVDALAAIVAQQSEDAKLANQ